MTGGGQTETDCSGGWGVGGGEWGRGGQTAVTNKQDRRQLSTSGGQMLCEQGQATVGWGWEGALP